MTYIDVMKYCLALPDASRQQLDGSGHAFALLVGSQMFGYFETGAPVHWQFSLRVDPKHYDTLINPPMVRPVPDRVDDHWITIQRVENFDGGKLKNLIDWSYQSAIAT